MRFDRSDRRILRELQLDSNQSNSALAARVGLSESACLRRVRALEQAGVIERYTAVVNAQKMGLALSFIIRITLRAQTDRDLRGFEDAVAAVPEVTGCDLTTGEADYVLRVVTRDSEDFERLHSKVLTQLPGVARVDSSFVLRQVVKQGAVPLE